MPSTQGLDFQGPQPVVLLTEGEQRGRVQKGLPRQEWGFGAGGGTSLHCSVPLSPGNLGNPQRGSQSCVQGREGGGSAGFPVWEKQIWTWASQHVSKSREGEHVP